MDLSIFGPRAPGVIGPLSWLGPTHCTHCVPVLVLARRQAARLAHVHVVNPCCAGALVALPRCGHDGALRQQCAHLRGGVKLLAVAPAQRLHMLARRKHQVAHLGRRRRQRRERHYVGRDASAIGILRQRQAHGFSFHWRG